MLKREFCNKIQENLFYYTNFFYPSFNFISPYNLTLHCFFCSSSPLYFFFLNYYFSSLIKKKKIISSSRSNFDLSVGSSTSSTNFLKIKTNNKKNKNQPFNQFNPFRPTTLEKIKFQNTTLLIKPVTNNNTISNSTPESLLNSSLSLTMSGIISKTSTSTFSAPVVQSRLEHHHQQQLLKQPESRQHQPHQRSKSLNKGKRGLSYNYQQKIKETTTTTEITNYSRFNNKNYSTYSNNFDSSYYREQKNIDVGYNNSSRPPRRHQHSDSVDEDKFRVTPNISILKRPQSADFVKSSNSKTTTSLDVTQEEQGFSDPRPHYRSNKVWEKSPRSQSKERRRSDVTPSNAKRPQRKEIKSMEFETDLILNVNSFQQNTTQLSGSGDESDVNSKYVKSVSSSTHNNIATQQTNNAVIFPPLNYSNAIIALEEGMNSNKKEDTNANSDDNATVKSSLNKKRLDNYVESTPRRLSSTAIELHSQVSRFADSDSILPYDSFLSSTPQSARRPSSSPSRLVHKLYAGPTFHNSPAPSDLPMPSFYGKSLGKEPSPLSACGNNLFPVPEHTPSPPIVHPNSDSYSSPSSGNTSDDDIFAMDDLEPSKVPYYPESPALRKQNSQELMRILASANARQQHQTAAAYMVPERMATAHHPMQVHPANSMNLNEISETLRSLLKIHGQ